MLACSQKSKPNTYTHLDIVMVSLVDIRNDPALSDISQYLAHDDLTLPCVDTLGLLFCSTPRS